MTSPENLGRQFEHGPIEHIPHTDRDGNPAHAWQMRDQKGNLLGHLSINKFGTIQQIETHPEVRRQGVATALYNAAKESHEKDPSIPRINHSGARTASGDSWARAVSKSEGAPLRERSQKVSKDTYTMRGAMWEMMMPLNKGE